jgi:predicted membrane chloride channel (bestrophin family)
VLLPDELNWLMSQPHKQLALGQALSSIVAAAHIDPITRTQMDSVITKWTFTFGAFGRIYNTAIPSAYTR